MPGGQVYGMEQHQVRVMMIDDDGHDDDGDGKIVFKM